jgi:UDP-3-O-[3-hydroxymyristoyl] glucosamine N-acyltransferase
MALTVSELLKVTGGKLANDSELGGDVLARAVDKPAPLLGSVASNISFFFSKEYQMELLRAAPGVLVTGDLFVAPMKQAGLPLWKKTAVIACADPYLAMAKVSERFAEEWSHGAHLKRPTVGAVHPSAVVSKDAQVDRTATIGAHCVIESGARISAGTVLYPGCYVGRGVAIGEDCVLFPHVSIYEDCQVGNRVRLHSGVVVGADGFGYAPRTEAGQVVEHLKIYHLGRVVIGDDVEVGANTCIDRGTLGETVIERMAKIDNLVQVAHNCHVGEGAILCGEVGMAGSSSVGKFAYVGGAAAISNKVKVGDRAQVGAMSGLTKDVPAGEVAIGYPQRSGREFYRVHALLNKLLDERSKKGKA